MEHWTPQNVGIEVPPTKLHTHDAVYDSLVEPTPAQLVSLVSDVITMGHTRKMGIFRPVFETLSKIGFDLDGADPVGFLEFPQTARDVVIVLGFDCDPATYPPHDMPTGRIDQSEFFRQHRAKSPVILEISVAGVFIRDQGSNPGTIAGRTLHLADDLPLFDFLLPLTPFAIDAFGMPKLKEWSTNTHIEYTQLVLDNLAKLGVERLYDGQPERTPDVPAQLYRDFERMCTLAVQAHQELS